MMVKKEGSIRYRPTEIDDVDDRRHNLYRRRRNPISRSLNEKCHPGCIGMAFMRV